MPSRSESEASSPEPVPRNLGMLWATATAVAALGNWMLFDALPGVNWILWTGAAVVGLLLFSGLHRRPDRSVLLIVAPIAIAGAAAVTASPVLWALMAIAIVFFL